ASIEGEFPASVRGRQADVVQHLIDGAVQAEIRTALRIRELRLKCLGEQPGLGLISPQGRRVIHLQIPVRSEAFAQRAVTCLQPSRYPPATSCRAAASERLVRTWMRPRSVSS